MTLPESDMDTHKKKIYARLMIHALWIPGVFVFCLVIAGLVLPNVLRPEIEKRISQTLHSSCRLGSLSFDPFSLTLTASDIAVAYPGDASMFLRLGSLEAGFSFSSFFRLTPDIKELKLDSPVIDLTLFENGEFSQNLLFSGQKSEPQGAPAIFPFVIRNFSINNGTVIFHDRIANTTHVVENIQITVPFASTLPEHKEVVLKPQVSATVNGRPLLLTAEARPFSNSLLTECTLRTEELELERFYKYIAPYTSLEIKSGALSTVLKLRIYRKEGESIRFTLAGETELRGLELAGPQGTAFKADRAQVELEYVWPGMQRIVINDISLDSPTITLRRTTDESVDWQDFFSATGQNEGDVSPTAFTVSRTSIRNGTIYWHDATVPGFAPYVVKNIQGLLSNVDSVGEGTADFSLEFGEGQGKFAAAGKISSNPLRVEGVMDMERMPLRPFSGYLTRATGMVLDGDLGLKGTFAVEYGARTTIRLGGVSLSNASATVPRNRTPLLAAGYLAANDIMTDVSAQRVTVGRVSGSGVKMSPIRGKDGNFTFVVPPKKNTAPSNDWQATVGSVQLDSTSITLTDTSLRDTAVLPFSDIRFLASTLSTQLNRRCTADISARPGRHGSLRLEMQGTLNPLALSFRARADRADIVFLSPYIKEAIGLSLSEGFLNMDVNGQLGTGRKSGAIRVEANGDAGVHGISLTTGERKEIIGWGRLRAEKFSYRSGLRDFGTLRVEKLILNGPHVAMTIGEDGTTNIERMLSSPTKKDAASTPPFAHEPSRVSAGGFSSVSIGGTRITSGDILLRDERLQPPYLIKLERFRMDMDKMSSELASQGEFEGSFRLNGSPIILEGKSNPLLTPFAGELTLDVRDLDLTAFSPYSTKFTGYPIRRGELTARIELSLRGFDVRGHNELVLGNLDVGDKEPSSDAPDMPIRAAIRLLRDLSGDISLVLPVSGRLDDPQFHIGGVMGKTVINTMLKTMAAPVTLVSGFFSIFVPKKRMERINFAPGEDRINRKMSDSLRVLVESLSKRARVRIELTGNADAREKTDMPLAKVMKAMRKIKYDALSDTEQAVTVPDRMRVGMHVDAEEYARLLREVYMSLPESGGSGPKSAREMMRTLRGNMVISDGQLKDLAEARANAVRNEIARIDPSFDQRITVGEPGVMSNDERGRLNSSVLIQIK